MIWKVIQFILKPLDVVLTVEDGIVSIVIGYAGHEVVGASYLIGPKERIVVTKRGDSV